MIPIFIKLQDGTPGLYSSLFGDLNRARVCSGFSGQMKHRFCSADWGSHGLSSHFTYHCRYGCWIGSATSHVIWVGSLVGQAEGCIQWWGGLHRRFPPWVQWEKQLWSQKSAVCWLNSVDLHPVLSPLPANLSAGVLFPGVANSLSDLMGLKTLSKRVTLSVSSLAWVGEGEAASGYSQFPTQAFCLGGARSNPQS